MADRMVIDSSVAAKWFLKDSLEEDIDLAVDILAAFLADDVELHAPRIFTYEVCGLLTKACNTLDPSTKKPRITVQYAKKCIQELFGLPIQISEASLEEGTEALQMAVDYSKTHGDMTFLRLAELHDCEWCTADAKVFRCGNRPGFPEDRVLLLSTLS